MSRPVLTEQVIGAGLVNARIVVDRSQGRLSRLMLSAVGAAQISRSSVAQGRPSRLSPPAPSATSSTDSRLRAPQGVPRRFEGRITEAPPVLWRWAGVRPLTLCRRPAPLSKWRWSPTSRPVTPSIESWPWPPSDHRNERQTNQGPCPGRENSDVIGLRWHLPSAVRRLSKAWRRRLPQGPLFASTECGHRCDRVKASLAALGAARP